MSSFTKKRWSKTIAIYTAFMLAPLYWLLVLSFQPNSTSTQNANIFPSPFSIENYAYIFSQPNWMNGYLNALIYVGINLLLTLCVALPAAFAFSRYRFAGKDQAFFFTFVFRLIPPAVMILPLVQMFSSVQLIDTHLAVSLAHCLFTVPISIWILEGTISSVPVELDEAAAADGYSRLRFFWQILLPQIRTGIAVAAFFSFMFSWVELILANALTTINAKPIGVVMRIVAEPLGGVHIGISAATSILMLLPGVALVWLMRNHLARGFSMGRIG